MKLFCFFVLLAVVCGKSIDDKTGLKLLLDLDAKVPLDVDIECVNNPNVVGSKSVTDILNLTLTQYITGKRQEHEFFPNGAEELTQSVYFEFSKPLVIMVHSELDSTPHLITGTTMAEAFNGIREYNVIALDCNRLLVPMTTRSAMAKYIGEGIALVLRDLAKNGYDLNDVQLIGHEIGAHVIGYAGKAFQVLTNGMKIPKLTALNPSSRCFETVAKIGRLADGDAEYVEVIHTISGYDMKKQIGDVDFYLIDSLPSGPWMEQWHNMVWRYYAESINNEKLFIGVKCESVENFKSGNCEWHELATLQYVFDESKRGSFYMRVGLQSPYGLGEIGTHPL